jgi:hypothetical protein
MEQVEVRMEGLVETMLPLLVGILTEVSSEALVVVALERVTEALEAVL